jgi:BirA family biotin operon repressor/biotin-[acetyl-CoA-carboxylase] ligase
VNHHKPLTPALVEPLLRGRFGRPYLWTESCPSTQDALRDARLPEGAVATTDHQTAGRGRAGRTWDDTPGAALLVSVLLRPPATAAVAQLSLVCALAVAETVEASIGRRAAVKWPNDVLVEGRKVAGILLEGREGAVACGIGLNVNQAETELPREPRAPAASLRTLTARDHDRARLLATLLERLEARYDAWLAEGLAPLLPELERRDALRGSAVTVGEVGGTADGIAADGRLRLRSADGAETLVASGEVDVSD